MSNLIINITDKVRIAEVDSNNICIQYKKLNKSTNELLWETKWFYGNLLQALNKLLNTGVNYRGELTLEQAVQRIEKTSKDLQNVVTKYYKARTQEVQNESRGAEKDSS